MAETDLATVNTAADRNGMAVITSAPTTSSFNFGIAFALVASTCYAVKVLSASPVYLLLGAYLLFSASRLTTAAIFRSHAALWVATLVFALYLTILALHGYLVRDEGVLLPTYINLFLGLLLVLVALGVWSEFDRSSVAISSLWGIYGVILIHALDTADRLLRPTAPTYEHLEAIGANAQMWFYQYKLGGFMFHDSNQSGIVLVAVLCTALAIYKVSGRGRPAIVVLLALIAATFSRAAWAAGFVTLLLYVLTRHGPLFRLAVVCVTVVVACVLVLNAAAVWDASLSSKISIVSTAADVIAEHPEMLPFGFGIGQSENILGIYGHIVPVTTLVETGVLGVLLYATVLYLFIIAGGRLVTMYIVSVFAVAGSSSFIYLGAACIFLPLVVVLLLDDPSHPDSTRGSFGQQF